MEDVDKLLEMANAVNFVDTVGPAALAIGAAILSFRVLIYGVRAVIRQVRG